VAEYGTAGLHKDNPVLDWVLPDDDDLRWMQAIGAFVDSRKQKLATEFVKYILGPDGQARLAMTSCCWAMPATASHSVDSGWPPNSVSTETGDDQSASIGCEVRSWTGWYRRVTLAMLAHACLAVLRRAAASVGGHAAVTGFAVPPA
jgi:ABC-type thiamine transport system substrate-binding protein